MVFVSKDRLHPSAPVAARTPLTHRGCKKAFFRSAYLDGVLLASERPNIARSFCLLICISKCSARCFGVDVTRVYTASCKRRFFYERSTQVSDVCGPVFCLLKLYFYLQNDCFRLQKTLEVNGDD
ncbi:hypothetical protein L596_011387 [Steinernema carpocapsae]|uniref:Uncharacterized protein n=1 Tax=Steinernema carpocapsae TaxID=34508 RepID=A0A4U5NUN7_STECR|nr:hypothetical protein L596_011387 [Steinernema carpocapsae]